MGSLFLGLDCSTQSLSAVVIDFDEKKVIFDKSLNFEATFPQYQTHKGTLRQDDPLVIHSPPLMWAEALDKMFALMKESGIDMKSIVAISGSAQQHGSVYLNESFEDALSHLKTAHSLTDALQNAFSRKTAPIWMDSSTTLECQEIQEAMGAKKAVIEATGSNTFERFTGPQIRKFYKKEPKKYEETEHIALVSSFMASIIAGKIAPIDFGDGSGMNLMDIRKKAWQPKALEATAPDLCKKLPDLAIPWKVIGKVSPYFTAKYGVNKNALALVWTGDNPSSIIGLGLIEDGMAAISLGTSFTYFGYLKECHVDPNGEGHLFVAPTNDYMTLNCFINGALAIEKLRNSYSINWDDFDEALRKTKPGNHNGLLLPYFEAEIVPKVLKPGLHRQHLNEKDVAANCRAIIEGQMMSMRIHSKWMKIKPKTIYATGGVSHRDTILQILADVHNAEVISSNVQKSTALGAALRAAFGYFTEVGTPISWKEIIKGFTDTGYHAKLKPNPDAVKIYDHLVSEYEKFEKQVLSKIF